MNKVELTDEMVEAGFGPYGGGAYADCGVLVIDVYPSTHGWRVHITNRTDGRSSTFADAMAVAMELAKTAKSIKALIAAQEVG